MNEEGVKQAMIEAITEGLQKHTVHEPRDIAKLLISYCEKRIAESSQAQALLS